MNKKAVSAMITIPIAVAIIIMALAFAPILTDQANSARSAGGIYGDEPGLDCSNTSLNTFQEANCLFTDLLTPAFILIIIGLAGVIITARLIIQ